MRDFRQVRLGRRAGSPGHRPREVRRSDQGHSRDRVRDEPGSPQHPPAARRGGFRRSRRRLWDVPDRRRVSIADRGRALDRGYRGRGPHPVFASGDAQPSHPPAVLRLGSGLHRGRRRERLRLGVLRVLPPDGHGHDLGHGLAPAREGARLRLDAPEPCGVLGGGHLRGAEGEEHLSRIQRRRPLSLPPPAELAIHTPATAHPGG